MNSFLNVNIGTFDSSYQYISDDMSYVVHRPGGVELFIEVPVCSFTKI